MFEARHDRPSVSRRGGRLRASHVSVRVLLTRPARLTSSRTVFLLYCSGDCHSPYFACDKSQPGKPDPLPPHAGVCFVCDQHRIAKKHQPGARLRREGGSRHGWFLVWPGGEAVKYGLAPRSGGNGRLHSHSKTSRTVQSDLHDDLGIATIRALSTLFTDSEVVKTWETSGSKVTTSLS